MLGGINKINAHPGNSQRELEQNYSDASSHKQGNEKEPSVAHDSIAFSGFSKLVQEYGFEVKSLQQPNSHQLLFSFYLNGLTFSFQVDTNTYSHNPSIDFAVIQSKSNDGLVFSLTTIAFSVTKSNIIKKKPQKLSVNTLLRLVDEINTLDFVGEVTYEKSVVIRVLTDEYEEDLKQELSAILSAVLQITESLKLVDLFSINFDQKPVREFTISSVKVIR